MSKSKKTTRKAPVVLKKIEQSGSGVVEVDVVKVSGSGGGRVLVDVKKQTNITTASARKYADAARARSTMRAYGSGMVGKPTPANGRKRGTPRRFPTFEAWCNEQGVEGLPASAEAVIDYLAHLADTGASVSTIDNRLAGIAALHRLAHMYDPTLDGEVKSVVKGIRRLNGKPPHRKQPIREDDLRAMIAALDLDTLQGLRDRAILTIGFGGAFRRSELVALDVGDVSRRKGEMKITIRKSKTDKQSKGMLRHFPADLPSDIDPVLAYREWVKAARIKSGPVFRRITRTGKLGGRLAGQSVALIVKRCAEAIGLDPRVVAGHSLRSGYITEASRKGARDGDIVEQTGQTWDTMQRYKHLAGRGAMAATRVAFAKTD